MLKSLMLGSLLVAGSATAAEAQTSAAPQKEKLVCKRVAGTGWRLSNSSKVCKTRAQWDSLSRTNREQFQDYNKGGSIGSMGDGAMGRSSTPG